MKNLVQRASRLLLALVLLGSFGLSSCHKDDPTTVYGNWTKGNGFSGTARRNAVSFLINNVAYVGTGIDINGKRYNDFWSYNPTTGIWAALTPMPAVERYNAVAFAVGNYGYVGTGYDGTNYLGDFWRFDPSQNTTTIVNGTTVTTVGKWTAIASIPAASTGTVGRYGAVAGSVGNLGYVGCGFNGNYLKDFFKYDPSNNTWSALGFPGEKRMGAVAFTVNGQMYVGTGINNGSVNTDFWSYNPTGDAWTQKRNTANQTTGSDIYDYSAVARNNAVAFTVGNYGYIATGSNGAVRNDCYQYDPSLDTWTKMNPLLGVARSAAVGFGIGNYGYVGTGANGNSPYDDFWRIDPSAEQQ